MLDQDKAALPLAAALMLFLPGAAFAQQVPPEIIDQRSGVIEVTASATVQYEPDRAYISFGVTSFAETAAEATEASAVKMNRIQDTLNRIGVGKGEVRTSAFRLDPRYPQDPETRQRGPQPDGYTAYNMVDVTLGDVLGAGDVIDAVIGAGADNVSNLRFGLEDMRPVQREALKMAYQNAESQAETLAGAAGRSLGTLLAIRTPPQSPGVPMVQAEMGLMRATSTPIEPGTLGFSSSVQVVFEIR